MKLVCIDVKIDKNTSLIVFQMRYLGHERIHSRLRLLFALIPMAQLRMEFKR